MNPVVKSVVCDDKLVHTHTLYNEIVLFETKGLSIFNCFLFVIASTVETKNKQQKNQSQKLVHCTERTA